MPIRWDKFTVKAQEAVQRANQLASEHGNPELRPFTCSPHCSKTKKASSRPCSKKSASARRPSCSEIYKEIEKLPKVSGRVRPGRRSRTKVNKLLEQAFKEAPISKTNTFPLSTCCSPSRISSAIRRSRC